MKKKVLSLVLSASMVSSMLPAMAYAADGTTTFPDMPNDWSTTALQSAIDNGLLNGIDGKIAASENLTRAQMAAIVTRAFGTNGNADISGFGDVNSGDWFYNAMAAAVNMGAFQGDGTGLNPNANITRQEAFTVLARLFTLSGADQSVLNSFSDAGQVADWAKDSMASMVQAGYVSGDRNMLKPTSSITRAEFAQVMYNLLSDYMVAGEDGTNVQGNAILNQTGTLSNVTVSGDLIVGDGAGEGDVTLNNVTVSGRLLVRGGGVNTVTLEGNTTVGGQIVVNKPTGDVRVHNSTSNEFDAAVISDGATLTGEFDVVEVTASGTTTVTGATVNTVNVSAAASLSVAGESKVDTVNLDAASSKLNVNGNSTVTTVNVPESASNASIDVANGSTVTNVNTAANGVSIDGEGKVSNVKVEGNNTSVDTVGTKVTVASGVTGTTSNGKDIAAGTTVTTTANGTTGGGSTGGSSDTGDNGETPVVDKAYKVSIGTFVGGKVTADITETDEANQTITLTVTPDAQNGETMPYVLKAESLKVTLGTGEEATDVEVTPGDNNTYTFTMDTEGTYTVTAEFVQPITKAEVFVIDDVESLKSLVTKGYVADEEELKNNFADPNGGTVNDELQANPWLAFGILRNTDFSTATIEKLDVKQNGVSVTNNSYHFPSLSGKAASAMLKGARPEFQDKDYLGFTHDYGTYDVTFTCEGAEYSFSVDYYPGDPSEYKTATFVVDGAEVEAYKGKTGDAITAPADPKKVGYTFQGWFDSEGTKLESQTYSADNTTWYAQWEAVKYTISYKDGNGDAAFDEGVVPKNEYTIEDDTYTLPTPSDKDGYTFAGWKNKDGEIVKEIAKGSTGNIELTAQWTKNVTLEDADLDLPGEVKAAIDGTTVTLSGNVQAGIPADTIGDTGTTYQEDFANVLGQDADRTAMAINIDAPANSVIRQTNSALNIYNQDGERVDAYVNSGVKVKHYTDAQTWYDFMIDNSENTEIKIEVFEGIENKENASDYAGVSALIDGKTPTVTYTINKGTLEIAVETISDESLDLPVQGITVSSSAVTSSSVQLTLAGTVAAGIPANDATVGDTNTKYVDDFANLVDSAADKGLTAMALNLGLDGDHFVIRQTNNALRAYNDEGPVDESVVDNVKVKYYASATDCNWYDFLMQDGTITIEVFQLDQAVEGGDAATLHQAAVTAITDKTPIKTITIDLSDVTIGAQA